MSNIGFDRDYLVSRFVFMSRETRSDIELKVMEGVRDTDTQEMLEARLAAAIKKEEDRQIQAGIRDSMERDMARRNDKSKRHGGLSLIQGGNSKPKLAEDNAA